MDLEQDLEEYQNGFQDSVQVSSLDGEELSITERFRLYCWVQAVVENFSVQSPQGWTLLPVYSWLPKVRSLRHKLAKFDRFCVLECWTCSASREGD